MVVELRSGGLSIDRIEFLLGIPSTAVPTSYNNTINQVAVATPELSILKSTKQHGFASVAYVAYWADTGELLTASGPYIGRTSREDYWILGTGPRHHRRYPAGAEPVMSMERRQKAELGREKFTGSLLLASDSCLLPKL